MGEKEGHDGMKNLIIVFAVLPLVVMLAVTFYMVGIKKHGTPAEYKKMQEELQKAHEDSLKALESAESPENVADSTLIGMGAYSEIIEQAKKKEAELQTIQASIDSLRALMDSLNTKEQTIDSKQETLAQGKAMLQNESAARLATLYDGMKTQLAVPLFIAMDDTLAVKVLSKMQQRSAGKLLGAIAEKDVNKAAKLNKLLSMKEVAQ